MNEAKLTDFAAAISETARDGRRMLVAIAGPPGAGKSTISEALKERLDHAAILPMDGFHLDNAVLEQRGRVHRKGAPDTFDVRGMIKLLEKVRAGGAVAVPTFDRSADMVVPEGALIEADKRIILVEGNYLLLDRPDWQDMHHFWDISILLHVPMAELQRRLVRRWLDNGLSPEDAIRRAEENDIQNAKTVLSQSIQPTFPAT